VDPYVNILGVFSTKKSVDAKAVWKGKLIVNELVDLTVVEPKDCAIDESIGVMVEDNTTIAFGAYW